MPDRKIRFPRRRRLSPGSRAIEPDRQFVLACAVLPAELLDGGAGAVSVHACDQCGRPVAAVGYGPTMSDEVACDRQRIRWLHEVLTGRDWRLESFNARQVDQRGYPTGRQPGWWYPSSLRVVLPQPIKDVSPEPLHCCYTLGTRDEVVGLLW